MRLKFAVFFNIVLCLSMVAMEPAKSDLESKFDKEDLETFTHETFQELIDAAETEREGLDLAVIPAPGALEDTYHFFKADELARYFKIQKEDDPINRSPVERVFLYSYKKSNNSFPFEYRGVLSSRDLVSRYGLDKEIRPLDFPLQWFRLYILSLWMLRH